jgi:hypothetical protein
MGDADIAIDVEMPVMTPPPPPMDAEPAPASHEAREPLPSQERLSTAPASVEPAALSDGDDGPAIEQGEVLADEADEEALAGEDEEAPVSSRRPVAAPPEERLAELAFGSGEPQPPRHTPPPKSGRLPAPPSLEFDPDVTGVRDAVAISAPEDDHTQPSAEAGRPPSVLVAQAARPNLAASPRVADVIGEAQAFAPATFLELLEASLSL